MIGPIGYACTLCPLHKTAKSVCVPAGPTTEGAVPNTDLFVVGQNPGYEEDKANRPFIGEPGKLIRSIFHDLNEEAVLSNAVKCYTKDNREPSLEEVNACRTHLVREILDLRPKVILALGNVALKALAGHSGVLNHRHQHQRLRADIKKQLVKNGIKEEDQPVILSTVHPAFVLRQIGYLEVLREDVAAAVRLTRQRKGLTKAVDAEFYQGTEETKFVNEVTFDIESTGLNYRAPGFKLHMIGALTDTGDTLIHTTEEAYSNFTHQLAKHQQTNVITFNGLAYDEPALRWLYKSRPRKVNDVLLLAYLLDETMPHHNLESCAVRWLGATPWKDDVTWKWEDGPQTPEEWERCKKYNARDVMFTRDLWHKLWARADEKTKILYNEIMVPAAMALVGMYEEGVYVSRLNITMARIEAEQEVERTLHILREWAEAGDPIPDNKQKVLFNPNSTRHVVNLLYNKLGFKPRKITPKGVPSTDGEALKLLAEQDQKAFDICHHLLDYRTGSKIVSGILNPWENAVEPDGRVHVQYRLTSTDTGRPSAKLIHQLPRKESVRKIVRAPDGYKLIVGDFSQIELRFAAFLSRDPVMLATYVDSLNGGDLHNTTALFIAKKLGFETFTKDHRQNAKGVNFGCLYCAEAPTVQAYMFKTYGLKVTLQEAEFFRNDVFHGTYTGLIPWYETVIKDLKKDHFVRGITNRIRHLPNIDSSDIELRAEAGRQAINTLIQGPASDFTLLALSRIHGNTNYREILTPVFEVHDSIGCYTPEHLVEDAVLNLRDVMENWPVDVLYSKFGVDFDVPIKADVKVCDEWT